MKQYVSLTLKKALQTYLVILPFAVIGGITVGMYTCEHSAPEVIEAAIEQLGSYQAMIAVTVIQTLVYSLFGWVIGYFIVERLGLMKPFRFEKVVLVKVCPVIVVLGFTFAADYFLMGRLIPEVAADYEKGISVAYFISSLTYGGVIEEILLRWFFMGFIALILVMIFARKTDKNEIPDWIFIVANVIAAIVFSAGHLPATQMFFGRITGLILFRCFLLNGAFALFFGRWFRKYGIQYAMLGHFGIHFISKIILICVI
ncbi:type II CAAX prenyl endopeptidase Rce1 family protein [Faecalicatena contorta]|uniref:CPBP family glutamic-type intramembrane protease n=1 Tax=Faecalicatena contorta TaxID=39482 RepID=UPI001F3815B5|nr:CPBP family glutamic-type intramembrane protease [Faecalicatena contorta]MCF2683647.1 CPBP family intramembrane metalloprotease [Faecalicatena contorta]